MTGPPISTLRGPSANFSLKSDDESSEEDKNKDDEAKGNVKGDGKDKDKEKEKEKEKEKDKGTPGTSTKGSNTPQGKQKLPDGKKNKTLKRPGSPNLSESSGNESARKKARKQAIASGQGSRSTTPLPGSQAVGAGSQPRPRMGGFTSDGEGTAGEMSDGGPKKKIKIVGLGTGAKNSPVGSRAGSPVPNALVAAQLASGPGEFRIHCVFAVLRKASLVFRRHMD